MKLAKGTIFFILMGLLASCFNPPEFPIVPEIAFKDIVFTKGSTGTDSLILTITFKDGDGDLGIDEGNPTFSSYPFHPINYFLELDGDTTKISTEKVYKNVPPLIKINKGQSGKLISVRTRNKPGYENLPAYNCYNYNFDSVYVSKENKSIFDESYYLKDSLVSSTDPTIYILLDTFYIENNPNHYNITVQFETKNSPGTDPQYSPFDWRKEYCTTFDGRFPVLTETKVPLEGSLKYAMPSSGFVDLFSGETLHLIIQIKDRALNLSNVIITPDFKID